MTPAQIRTLDIPALESICGFSRHCDNGERAVLGALVSYMGIAETELCMRRTIRNHGTVAVRDFAERLLTLCDEIDHPSDA